MLIIKYDRKMPELSDHWIENVYYNSWFYQVYKVKIENGFLSILDIEKMPIKLLCEFFNDLVRFLLKNFEDFKLIEFEINLIVNNYDNILSDYIGISQSPKLIYLKYTLVKGRLDRSYQLLDNINTIKY